MCVYMWYMWSDVCRCMFACVVDVRDWHQVSSSNTPVCLPRLGLSLDPELADLSSGCRQLALGPPVSTSEL